MFHSVYENATRETKKPADEKNDGQGEPLRKPSRTSEVSHQLSRHEDGHYSVLTPEEGLSHHDDYESASEHMSTAVHTTGDNFGMDSEPTGKPSKPSMPGKAGSRSNGPAGSEM